MKLSKVDLSNVVAIAHQDGNLGLLIVRGEELEIVEIPAPIEAFEGLQLLNEIVAGTEVLLSEEEVPLLPVDSTMANAIGYDKDKEILQIEFKNGSVYQYSGVDEHTWEDFYYSDSIGSFFNEEIKGQYHSERVD
jgi:hypothetical protein